MTDATDAGAQAPVSDPRAMMSPVKCSYDGKVYDLTRVEVKARYADCTVFMTPCCNRKVDDRMFIGQPAFRRITTEELKQGPTYVTKEGYIVHAW